MKKKAAGL